MRKFSLAWWAYSFPLTVLALCSAEYAQEVKGGAAHTMMLVLLALSVLVALLLMTFTVLNTDVLVIDPIPELKPNSDAGSENSDQSDCSVSSSVSS